MCDIGKGIEHFRTPVDLGIDIINELRFSLSGFAIPTFVIDAPNGGGKFPISNNYIIDRSDDRQVLSYKKGNEYVYPEIKK